MTSGAFRIAQTLALVLTLALSALILDGALPAQAATFTVTRFDDPVPDGCNSGVDCSLREAIIAANAAPGADTIILPAGIYTLAIAGAGDNVAATGDLDITDDLTLTGDGAATTIIDGGALDRVLAGIHRTRDPIRLPGHANRCPSEAGMMVCEQPIDPEQGAPVRCDHRTASTGLKRPSTTTAWWPTRGCCCRPRSPSISVCSSSSTPTSTSGLPRVGRTSGTSC